MKTRQRRKNAPSSTGFGGPARSPIALAQLRAMADASPTVGRQQARQRLADGAAVQRMDGLEEEPMQGKALQRAAMEDEMLQGKALQRVGDDEDLLQGKAAPGADAGGQTASAERSGGGLPDPLRAGVESLSGMAMDDVRVHYGSQEPANVGALAYAQGRDIHLGPGQERHLPHEAWHVVQQAQGRVQPTTDVGGVAVNDSTALESEADVQGARALAAGATALTQRDE